jgi:cathepsin B
LVEEVKTATSSWTPYEPEENPFKDWSESDIRGLFGTVLQESEVKPSGIVDNGVPDSFDSRTEWPDCIHPIRDQAKCGSCWAFAGSETFSDRVCINSKGKTNVILSPQDMVSCDSWNMGCNGGILSWAWSYLKSTGIVADSCFPYSSETGTAPKCASKCADGSAWKKYKCKDTISKSGVDDIKAEIYKDGPLETGFTVYEDFMSYKSGIYTHTTGSQLGGHAVKMVGWGNENGTGYWIIANSWGTGWGESGFFRIKFGDCGIDSAAYGCTPADN